MSSVHTHPSPRSPKTARFRAPAEPATSRGFLLRRYDMDCFDDLPEKKSTQDEQDEEDEKARKRAMRNLVNSWQERLQLISVIATFFASTEAAMLVNTKPGNDTELKNTFLRVSNASLIGALIMHVYAAVLAFFGAFLLISYKLREATREELIAEGIPVTSSPVVDPVVRDVEQGPLNLGQRQMPTSTNAQGTTRSSTTAMSAPEQNRTNGEGQRVFSANPHIEQVGVVLFKSEMTPHQLLDRTHAICILLAGIGFVLNLIGILCYSWALQPTAVSIFASVCLGGAILTLLTLRM